MANAALLKGGVIVVLLLAALAVFDFSGNYAQSQITGRQVAGGLPDINITTFRADVAGDSVSVSYSVNNNGDVDVDVPFFIVTRLNYYDIVRNISVDRLEKEPPGTLQSARGKTDSFAIEMLNLNCGENDIELSADDSMAVAEKYEFNNKRKVYVYRPCAGKTALPVVVREGWNIIGINTLRGFIEMCGDGVDDISDIVWAYYPQANDYGRYKLSADFRRPKSAGDDKSDNYRNAYPDTTSTTRAIWLYNKGGPCTITSDLTSYTGLGLFKISAGWNMLAVQPNWQGKRFSEVMGTCRQPEAWAEGVAGLEAGLAGYFYELPIGWDVISLDTVFKQEKVGKGFWTYAVQECQFGVSP